jgi:hypothetical protein
MSQPYNKTQPPTDFCGISDQNKKLITDLNLMLSSRIQSVLTPLPHRPYGMMHRHRGMFTFICNGKIKPQILKSSTISFYKLTIIPRLYRITHFTVNFICLQYCYGSFSSADFSIVTFRHCLHK